MSTNQAVKISVCIASVRSQTLAATVRSLCRQTFQEWELVVIGQGDAEAGRRATSDGAQGDPRVCFVHLLERGLSRARNAGMRATQGEIVAMTDDDCEANPDWLAVLWDTFAQHPNVGVVGGALVAPPPPRAIFKVCPYNLPAEAIYDPVQTPQQPPPGCDWVGANFALRRNVAEQIGAFDEQLGAGTAFPAAEDTDYKLRTERLGITMLSTPRAVVHHTYGYRTGLKAAMGFQRAYATGNGAMAAKLTLQDDPRGPEWLRTTRRECAVNVKKLHRMPLNLRRLRFYEAAYRQCLQHYTIDASGTVLVPRAG